MARFWRSGAARPTGFSKRFIPVLGSALAGLSGLFIWLWLAAWTQPLELALYDRMLRGRSEMAPDPRLLVVGIDETDIRQSGWPVPNELIGRALLELVNLDAALIGVDLYRDADSAVSAPAWQAALDDPRISFIREIGTLGGESIPAPSGLPDERIGASDLVTDPDGIIRRLLLYLKPEDGTAQPTLAMLLARRWLAMQGIEMRAATDDPRAFMLGAARFDPLTGTGGGYRRIDAGGLQVMLNFRPGKVAELINLRDLLAGTVSRERVAGRIVVLGTAARSIKDTHLTPYANQGDAMRVMPGVLVHAHAISHLLSVATNAAAEPVAGYPAVIGTWPFWADILWILSWMLIGALLIWRVSSPNGLAVFLVLGVPVILALGTALLYLGTWVPTATAALGFVLVFLVLGTLRWALHFRADPVTGLPNRSRLAARLGARRVGSLGAASLVSIHLDRIAAIRAVFGQQAAEQAMMEAVDAMRMICAQTGLRAGLNGPLYRIGEAAFAVFLKADPDTSRASSLAARLGRRLEAAFSTGHGDVYLGAQLGIAAASDLGGGSLLDAAESAAYQAKAMDLRAPKRFVSATRDAQRERLLLEQDLRDMLRDQDDAKLRDLFPVYYQPLIDLKRDRLAGFEALMRWRHPERGIVSPGLFIPIAEGTDLIIDLGHWILREACRQTVEWQGSLAGCKGLFISVNVAAKQLAQGDQLISQVDSALSSTGLSPESLKLEITESGVIGDFDSALITLGRLREKGVKLSIDDFGTGYSSLSYLTRLPVNSLKVDQAFVRTMSEAPRNRALVEAIVGLAQRLGLEVITEGIEEPEQCAFIRQLGSEFGQGFMFSRPVPADDARVLLSESLAGPWYDAMS